jgi:hypothetical protein
MRNWANIAESQDPNQLRTPRTESGSASHVWGTVQNGHKPIHNGCKAVRGATFAGSNRGDHLVNK